MKKYIKASDGSFVSFAKKDKKTFKPVSAACGGKKKVKGNEEVRECPKCHRLLKNDEDVCPECNEPGKTTDKASWEKKYGKVEHDDIKSSKRVSRSRNISASYDEYDEDINLPGKIRHQIAELTGWGEDDIAFAFQQWIYDGGGEYDPDEMPKRFRDDIASDVESGEDIEAKYLGD